MGLRKALDGTVAMRLGQHRDVQGTGSSRTKDGTVDRSNVGRIVGRGRTVAVGRTVLVGHCLVVDSHVGHIAGRLPRAASYDSAVGTVK